MQIRLFIYDDNADRRDSLRALLSLNDNLKYVGEAPNCLHVKEEIEKYYPDVVLMDINMPEVDGIEGLKIIKSTYPEIKAIEEVYQGGASMNPAIAQKVLDFFTPQKTKSPLSPKENEVLALLAEGLSYKMVADKLGVSYSTINTHIKRIYEKLHISSLGEAIAYYYKNVK